MAFKLFRSYVLLIVLCIIMVLIDKSQSVLIPSGCKITLAKNNTIELPRGFKIHPPKRYQGSFPSNWLSKTFNGQMIVNLPKGWAVTMPEGFKVEIPSKIKMPSRGWFGNSPTNCKMTLSTGWTITPTKTWTDDLPEEFIEITIEARTENSIEITVEARIPHCTVHLSEDNKVILPNGYTINPPEGYLVELPRNYLEQTAEGSIVNPPYGWSVSLPDGFKIAPPKGWKEVPLNEWFKMTYNGLTVSLPIGWIVKPTDEFKENNNGGVIDAFLALSRDVFRSRRT